METPSDYPKIVYKYRSWDNPVHQRVLKFNELFVSSPKNSNDPFDCRIPINYSQLDTPEKIKRFVEFSTIKHFTYLVQNGTNLPEQMENLEDRLTNHISEFQKEHENILFEGQDKHYGILSLSAVWDNILMWSHYSNNHKGFCVGFWEEKLRNSELFGKGGPVRYSEDFPVLDPFKEDFIDYSFTETHTKAKDWAYEMEYRLTKTFYPEIPTIEDRRFTIENDVFAGIVLGLEIDSAHKQEIYEIARSKRIPIYESFKVPFKFLIDRREIV